MILNPIMIGYTHNELSMKFIGGTMQFLPNAKGVVGRYIDTTNMDVSVWISDMRKVVSASIIYFYVNIYDPGASVSYTIPLFRGVTTSTVNGFTLPKRVYDLGISRRIYEIGVVVVNADTSNNHEFFYWAGGTPSNQYIVLRAE